MLLLDNQVTIFKMASDNDDQQPPIGHDETDFVAKITHPEDISLKMKTPLENMQQQMNGGLNLSPSEEINNSPTSPKEDTKRSSGTIFSDFEVRYVKSPLERLPIFKIQHRKKTDPTNNETPSKEKQKFVKTASLVRLLGNTYSTTRKQTNVTQNNPPKVQNGGERFQKCIEVEDQGENFGVPIDGDDHHDKDISARAFRTLAKGLGKLLRRRTNSVDISPPDPEFKVSYLGNVLTGWAKGEGCVEKPLSTLWRNYTQNSKPDVLMRMKICPSGLKATTKQHGLTEYWSHRITHCSAPKNYPRVFCWIYRHEGRKLKHELRCHAVLCSKESIAKNICATLQENLFRALKEFKRDKLSRQNARLSLANAVYDNPSMPRRKILLSVGGNNYRPPLERSKSAPKLMAIEEAIGEEDEDDESGEKQESGGNEQKSCCREDSLYPAMTLGRRRCRKGHSIRRTGRRNVTIKLESEIIKESTDTVDQDDEDENNEKDEISTVPKLEDKEASLPPVNYSAKSETRNTKNSIKTSMSSTESEEELDNLLLDSEPLVGEIMSYFEMKLKPSKTASLSDLNNMGDENVGIKTNLSLDNLDKYSDVEDNDGIDDSVFFSQNELLALFRKETIEKNYGDYSGNNHAIRSNMGGRCQHTATGLRLNEPFASHKLTPVAASESDEPHPTKSPSPSPPPPSILCFGNGNCIPAQLDSDEGSISSGCETASTVTNNMEDTLSTECNKDNEKHDSNDSDEVLLDPLGEKIKMTSPFRRSITFPPGAKQSDTVDSDSEFSDESGFSEFQDNTTSRAKSVLA